MPKGKDQQRSSIPLAFGPGSTFGAYLITRAIGSGGMAKVYEAVHVGLKKRVALKALSPELGADAAARERFLREGEAASRIRHPNVVDITDVGELHGVTYLVMEYLEGETLDALLVRQDRLDPRRMADIMIPVIDAVVAAHQVDVVHRDIKPDNIFLTRTTHGVSPKVLDFGISRVIDATPTRSSSEHSLLGTPYYMSPEQAKDFSRVDARGDQYALGVVMYQCLTGTLPYDAEELMDLLHAITEGALVPPSQRGPTLPPELEAIVMRAMACEPKDRFASCADLGVALLPFASRRTRTLWETSFGVGRNEDSVPPPGGDDGLRSSDRPIGDVADVTFPPPPRMPSTAHGSSGRTALPVREATSSGAGDHDDHGGELDSSGRDTRKSFAKIAVVAGAVAISVAIGVVFVAGGLETSAPTSAPHTEPHPPAPPTSFAVAPAEGVSVDEEGESPAPFRISVRVEPPEASIVLDGEPVGTGALEREVPSDGVAHQLMIALEGYVPQTLTFANALPPMTVTLDPVPIEFRTVQRRADPNAPNSIATTAPTALIEEGAVFRNEPDTATESGTGGGTESGSNTTIESVTTVIVPHEAPAPVPPTPAPRSE